MFQRNLFLNTILVLILFVGIVRPALAADVVAEPASSTGKSMVWASPIKLFQKIISRADGPRCPMHPTCSQYASEAFQHHNAVTAWVLTCDRLLRCGRDETRRTAPVRVHGRRRALDPLKANTFWWTRPSND